MGIFRTSEIANGACRAGQRCGGPWGAVMALGAGTILHDAGGVKGGRVGRTTLAKIPCLALTYDILKKHSKITYVISFIYQYYMFKV